MFYWATKQWLNDETIKALFSTANENGGFREHLTWSTLYFQNWGEEETFPVKKRRLSAADGFNKIEKASEAFMNYQEADRRFWEAEEKRERREEERNDEKKIWSFSWNWCTHSTSEIVYFHTGLHRLSKLHESYFIKELRTAIHQEIESFQFSVDKNLVPE